MGPKPGFKTTEFWVVVLTFFVAMISGLSITDGVVSYQLNQEVVQWWILGAGAGYPISRGLSKVGGNASPAAA